MTPFEIIICIALYLFAFSYTANSFYMPNKHNTWKDRLLLVLTAGTIGVIYFPMILAIDIWNKLNNEE